MTALTLDSLKFDPQTGLIPVVTQDARSGAVLMQAWADRAAVARTLDTREATYWSRSRGEQWVKGATSGHTQQVVDVQADCDGDSLLYRVVQTGPACHTGAYSCYHQPLLTTGAPRPDWTTRWTACTPPSPNGWPPCPRTATWPACTPGPGPRPEEDQRGKRRGPPGREERRPRRTRHRGRRPALPHPLRHGRGRRQPRRRRRRPPGTRGPHRTQGTQRGGMRGVGCRLWG